MASARIEPTPYANFIVGENGAGKSSLLEAISVLAHAKSFRTHKFRRLIKDEQKAFTVFAKLKSKDEVETTVGIERGRSGDSRFKIAGLAIQSSAQLAQQLPLLVINSNSFSLLEGPPKGRRMFFDWLVFHVKHEFADLWKQVSRCIKQRNTLLRRDKISYSDVEPWDAEIARLSSAIHEARLTCLELFKVEFDNSMAETKFAASSLALEYVSGWKPDAGSFQEQLAASFERDCHLGYTTLGPHKSDLKILIGRVPAVEVLSRGQQKVLISALFFSEAKVFKQISGRSPVFLIDDLPSELDDRHQNLLSSWTLSLSAQVFVTGISPGVLFDSGAWSNYEEHQKKVFHVKHGEVDNFDETPGKPSE